MIGSLFHTKKVKYKKMFGKDKATRSVVIRSILSLHTSDALLMFVDRRYRRAVIADTTSTYSLGRSQGDLSSSSYTPHLAYLHKCNCENIIFCCFIVNVNASSYNSYNWCVQL